jgi:hypothetical protein
LKAGLHRSISAKAGFHARLLVRFYVTRLFLSGKIKRRRTAKMRETRINESGHIVVKNLSAYWIPEIKVEREIHGTVYTVTGSFEGNEFLEKKLTRILLKNVEDAK